MWQNAQTSWASVPLATHSNLFSQHQSRERCCLQCKMNSYWGRTPEVHLRPPSVHPYINTCIFIDMYTPPNTTSLKGRDINIKNSHMAYLILLSNHLWRHMRHSCVSCTMYQSLFSGPTLDCIQLIDCLVNYDNQTSTTIRIEIFLCFILSVSYIHIYNKL